ncbi:unnamed protein product [Ascophyllum nodosum]
MAFCVSYLEGCLYYGGNCFDPAYSPLWNTISFHGFMDDGINFTTNNASQAVEEKYHGCSVIPLSQLEVNKTGVENGDITSFSASFFFLWIEDILGDYDRTASGHSINTQFVKVFFIDLDESNVDAIKEDNVNAKLPYERINITKDADFVAIQNDMVLTMTEFVGISSTSGAKQKAERTYSQSTTSATQNWWWAENGYDVMFSFLSLDITIAKFEYTRIEEVDPVDGWAIVGSIGGVWQFVVLGFGLFFVYAEKQQPDMKMRNMRKTMLKPASIVTHRLSNSSSRSSDQDIEVDTSDEDLPVEWVKKQRRNGSFYYFNIMTGAVQERSPTDHGDANAATGPRPSNLARIFRMSQRNHPVQPFDTSQGSLISTIHDHRSNDQGDERLPPGWLARIDNKGRTYYKNTTLKTTQWQRPTQRVPSNRRMGVQAIDTPAARSCEYFTSSSAHTHESKQEAKTQGLSNSVEAFPSAEIIPSAALQKIASAEVEASLSLN